MARQKKTDEKSKDVASITMNVEDFVRTRDSVVTGLASLQEVIQQLSNAYIKHTNTVLHEHGAGLDIDSALSRFDNNPLLSNLAGLRTGSPAKSDSGAQPGDKKKRARKAPDPLAPKRPLTPFFLYMQTARPIIAGDLGDSVEKGEVSLEGQRRWKAMEDDARILWTNAYKDNLRLYTARTHAYKAGNVGAKDMSDEDAQAYYDEHNLGGNDASAHNQLTAEALDANADPVDVDAEPAPKTPKAKPSRKKNTPKATPAAEQGSAIVPPGSKQAEKEKSPEKKRKRKSKADELAESIEETETPGEKKGSRKRTKKAS